MPFPYLSMFAECFVFLVVSTCVCRRREPGELAGVFVGAGLARDSWTVRDPLQLRLEWGGNPRSNPQFAGRVLRSISSLSASQAVESVVTVKELIVTRVGREQCEYAVEGRMVVIGARNIRVFKIAK